MTKRLPATAAPMPLEEYAARFDDLFTRRCQREGFRHYLAGLLLPAERNKTATALANTEPVTGAQHPRAQRLQWSLSASAWDADAVNARRLALLRADPATAPEGRGVLVIDEHGDRKWGRKTAHVGRQYLANLGETDSGVVAVTSLWADEAAYWPVDYEPYTPKHQFATGAADPDFRTKRAIAGELVTSAVEEGRPLRAVVADSFYGEDAGFRQRLHELAVGYVLALRPAHTWWHQEGSIGALWQAAELAGWRGPASPGAWVAVARRFRDGHAERWWALEVEAGPYGPTRGRRAVVVTTDPATLPDHTTWYLATNLPAGEADLAEVVRLYGLRMWIEQAYRQTKHALGWSQYQVRSDAAIRRHWQLVCCAFSFCWRQRPALAADAAPALGEGGAGPAADEAAGRGENAPRPPAGVLAGGAARRPRLAGAVGPAPALLAGVVTAAPARAARGPARPTLLRPRP